LATDPASDKLLERKPDKKTAPLFSVDMYKQILIQSIYQVIVILLFHFLGSKILGLETHSNSKEDRNNELIVKSLVFNAFVFAQIFNSVNCRRLDKKLNVFEGITRNYYFIGITLLEMAIQTVIMFVGGAAFQVTRIGGREWGISLALGVVSIPLGALIRLLPNPPFEALFKLMRLLPRDVLLPTTQEWSPADRVLDHLRTFGNLRGGRMRANSFVLKSRSGRILNDPPPKISALMAMIPTFVVSGVATNWKQQQAGSTPDPANPSTSSVALLEGSTQIHPDTRPDHPAYKLFGRVKPPAFNV